MRFTISGKNIEVTDSLRKAVTEKLGKLERYFTADTPIIVTMSVEKERQKIEVTIPLKGNVIRSEQVSNDMYVSIDLVEEVIERQLRKYKQKLIDRHQAGDNFRREACVQMELLGHSFYVFCNAETDQVNVVYKRKGGTYGLIEPEA